VIPGSVKTVGMQAFARSVNIKSVTFSDGVEDIAKGAFSGCSGLTDIIIPDSVKSIGEGTFNGCSGLTSITLPFVGSGIERPTNYDDSEFRQTLFGYIFGVEYYEGSAKTEQFSSAPSSGTVFYLPFGLETVTVTGGSIYGLAFDGCNNLKKIAVGDGVKRIGNYAFSECKSLAELDLPYLNETAESSISRPICFLFNWGYYNNSYIVNSSLDDGKNFYVPNSLVSVTVRGGWIGNIAFEGMKTLESVTFGDGVRSLGKNVFKGCNALEQVVFTKKGWMLKADDGMTDIDLSDSAINVEKLKGEYADLELVRKLPR
ncbi:MAG: leucine-rich repeat protein, partial [Clostridia bacterium]|nr:leucine-rich repeat protein [Clostridia bacterium]